MKTNILRPIKTALSLCILNCCIIAPSHAQSDTRDLALLMEKGLYLEETKRDLPGAIDTYSQILAAPEIPGQEHPALTMQARFRLASCQIKSGNVDAAKETLRGLIDALPSPEALAQDQSNLPDSFDRHLSEILERALPDLDREALLEAAFTGIASKLGQGAGYFGKSDNAFTPVDELVGIGAILDLKDERLMIAGVIPDAPASEAGLDTFDEILEIDGRSPTKDFDGLFDVVNAVRGAAHTIVNLTVRRWGSDTLEHVALTRRKLELNETRSAIGMGATEDTAIIEPELGIAGVKIKSFSLGTAESFRQLIDEASDEGMKALVIDLRGNGGGSPDECVKIADLFLREGLILKIEARSEAEVKDFHATEPDTFPNFPIAILVDGRTASTAEVLAAALQDHKRAVIVGERTYGAGIVKQVVSVTDGGRMLIPIASYARPSGARIQKPADDSGVTSDDWGVRPNEGFSIENALIPGSEDKALTRTLRYLREQIAE